MNQIALSPEDAKAILKCAKQAFSNQQARAVKKTGFGLPFTSIDLAAWLDAQRVGASAWQCQYCQSILVLSGAEIDHRRPISRGGSFSIQNLCIACKLCNQTKGELTDIEFVQITTFLRNLDYGAEQHVLKCLRTAAMGARMRYFPRTKKSTAGPATA